MRCGAAFRNNVVCREHQRALLRRGACNHASGPGAHPAAHEEAYGDLERFNGALFSIFQDDAFLALLALRIYVGSPFSAMDPRHHAHQPPIVCPMQTSERAIPPTWHTTSPSHPAYPLVTPPQGPNHTRPQPPQDHKIPLFFLTEVQPLPSEDSREIPTRMSFWCASSPQRASWPGPLHRSRVFKRTFI